MGDFVRDDGKSISRAGLRPLLGFVLVILLIAAVAAEAYYISVLRHRIDEQTEEVRSLSMRLQSSKSAGSELREELSSMKKMSGEKNDGNTADGQH